MSLVGKELEVRFGSTVATETDEEVSSTGDETHPPLSPASGAEALFMPGLLTSQISANALATELRKNYRPFRSNSTVATDDFVSTYDNMDDLIKFENTVSREAPALSKQPIYEFEEDPNMSTPKINVDEVNVNAAEQVYGVAKDVWGWGKEQMVIKTFLGITEAVAGKVVGVVGTDLEEIDGNIKPKLSELDSSIINPAVRAILGVILNAAGKSEDIFKPIIVSILKPIGLIKDSSKTDPIAPELTNTSTTARVS